MVETFETTPKEREGKKHCFSHEEHGVYDVVNKMLCQTFEKRKLFLASRRLLYSVCYERKWGEKDKKKLTQKKKEADSLKGAWHASCNRLKFLLHVPSNKSISTTIFPRKTTISWWFSMRAFYLHFTYRLFW